MPAAQSLNRGVLSAADVAAPTYAEAVARIILVLREPYVRQGGSDLCYKPGPGYWLPVGIHKKKGPG